MKEPYYIGDMIIDDEDNSFGILISKKTEVSFIVRWFNLPNNNLGTAGSDIIFDTHFVTVETKENITRLYRRVA